MILSVQQTQNKFIESIYQKAMRDLNRFFEINWKENKPQIFLIPDRKTYNLVFDKKTEDWVIGSINGDRMVFLLAPEKFEKESCHSFSKDDYRKLICHELCHCFVQEISCRGYIPKWLDEGLSLYKAKQLKGKIRPKKPKTFLKFYDEFNYKVYEESGFFVEALINTFGKKKFLRLLSSLSKVRNQKEFKQVFAKIYKSPPSYLFFQKIYCP